MFRLFICFHDLLMSYRLPAGLQLIRQKNGGTPQTLPASRGSKRGVKKRNLRWNLMMGTNRVPPLRKLQNKIRKKKKKKQCRSKYWTWSQSLHIDGNDRESLLSLGCFSSTIRVIYAWEGSLTLFFPAAHKTRLKWSLLVLIDRIITQVGQHGPTRRRG